MLADDAVERREDRRVAEVGLGDGEVALGVLDVRPRIVALGLGAVVGVLGRDVLAEQDFLAGEFGLRLDQRRLGTVELGLGLLDLGLVHRLLDAEELVALLLFGAVDIVLRDQEALDAGNEVDGREGHRVAGEHLEGRDVLLHRHTDADLGRRRRLELVLLLAAGHQPGQRDRRQEGHQAPNPPCDCKNYGFIATIRHVSDEAPREAGPSVSASTAGLPQSGPSQPIEKQRQIVRRHFDDLRDREPARSGELGDGL